MERETGLEPATFSLARRRSTTELLPLAFITHSTRVRPGYLGTHYTQVTVCGRTETILTRRPRAIRPNPLSHPLPGLPVAKSDKRKHGLIGRLKWVYATPIIRLQYGVFCSAPT